MEQPKRIARVRHAPARSASRASAPWACLFTALLAACSSGGASPAVAPEGSAGDSGPTEAAVPVDSGIVQDASQLDSAGLVLEASELDGGSMLPESDAAIGGDPDAEASLKQREMP